MRWDTQGGGRLAASIMVLAVAGCGPGAGSDLDLEWGGLRDRPWAGAHLWANRLQDWEVRDERLRVRASLPMRTVHILTRRGAPERGEFTLRAQVGLEASGGGPADSGSAIGFLLGAGGLHLDPRRAALIHHSPGPGGGLFVGVDETGHIMVADFSRGMEPLARSEEPIAATDRFTLQASIRRGEGGGALLLSVATLSTPVSETTLEFPLPSWEPVSGGLALAFHGAGESGPLGWFQAVSLDGPGVEVVEGGELGPILGVQHILHGGELSLMAQLLPVSGPADGSGEPSADSVRLEIRNGGGAWELLATEGVVVPGYTATFREEDWPRDRDVPYRLRYLPGPGRGEAGSAYRGTIRAEPLEAAILRSEYSDTWHPTTDGGGKALAIGEPLAHPATWSEPESWRPASPTPGW